MKRRKIYLFYNFIKVNVIFIPNYNCHHICTLECLEFDRPDKACVIPTYSQYFTLSSIDDWDVAYMFFHYWPYLQLEQELLWVYSMTY